jgi:hypothetical protein
MCQCPAKHDVSLNKLPSPASAVYAQRYRLTVIMSALRTRPECLFHVPPSLQIITKGIEMRTRSLLISLAATGFRDDDTVACQIAEVARLNTCQDWQGSRSESDDIAIMHTVHLVPALCFKVDTELFRMIISHNAQRHRREHVLAVPSLRELVLNEPA